MTAPPPQLCRSTGKRIYATEQLAQTTLNKRWGKMSPGRQYETRTYQCPFCENWHLTKSPERK